MDGTIVDTKACHYATWEALLKKHGHNLDREVYDANFGRNTRTALPLFWGFKPDEAYLESLIEEKDALFRERAPFEVQLIAGVEGWLAAAQQCGIPQAIASSNSLASINAMVSVFDLGGYFSAIVSGATLPAKPEPDVFLEAARQLGRAPAECLVIEDSVPGVQAAKNADMVCIAVTTTWPRAALSLADIVVDDFTRPLPPLLRALGLP
jgi:HAD superfamily hydrolase (TIGR01509 family)